MAGEKKIRVRCPKCGTEIVVVIVPEYPSHDPLYPLPPSYEWRRVYVKAR